MMTKSLLYFSNFLFILENQLKPLTYTSTKLRISHANNFIDYCFFIVIFSWENYHSEINKNQYA